MRAVLHLGVRTAYLFAAVASALAATAVLYAFIGTFLEPSWQRARLHAGDLILPALALFVYLLPSLRAFVRTLRQGSVISEPLLRERPVVASIVGFASLAGSALVLLLASVWIDALRRPEYLDDIGGPVGGVIFLIMMLYAAGLLIGECVLVGRARPGAA
jgi:hypothetical protein